MHGSPGKRFTPARPDTRTSGALLTRPELSEGSRPVQEQKRPWQYEKGGSPRAGWGEARGGGPFPTQACASWTWSFLAVSTKRPWRRRADKHPGRAPHTSCWERPPTRGGSAELRPRVQRGALEGHCQGGAGASLRGCSSGRDAMLFQNSNPRTAWRVFFTPSRASLLVRPFGRVLARHSFRPVTAESRHCGWSGPRQWPDHSLSQLNLGLLGSPANTVADYQRPRLPVSLSHSPLNN